MHNLKGGAVEIVVPDISTVKKYLAPTTDHQTPAYAATLAVTVKEDLTILEPATLGGALTVNLTIDALVMKGAKLQLIVTSDASARAITPGTGFLAPAFNTVSGKKHSQLYIYNGTAFVAAGPQIQLN